MNKALLIGRIVRTPEIRYSQGERASAVARYTLAVDRKYKQEGQANADFINCIAFGKLAEFAEKYLRQGIKIAVTGRIQTGSYTGKDGQKIYTTDVVIEEQEFCESKSNSQQSQSQQPAQSPYGPVDGDGFMNIDPNIDDELPFS